MPDKPLLDAALEYAARGWPVFPCKPESAPRLPDGKADKRPLTKNGVLNATTNTAQITKWWTATPDANIGLDVGGAGMMVLDYDPGFNLEELEQNVGPIPKTKLRSRTPRGGEHCFLTLGHDEHVPASTSKLAAHVDVRSFHSYVLLPPSQTKDGDYAWIEDGAPAHRSERILHGVSTGRSKSEDRDEWIIEPDLKENIALATSWLRNKAKIATEGVGGEACAFATAAMCKSYGLSEEVAFDQMMEHWSPRCNGPWDSEEDQDYLRVRVENAYHYNASPPGNMTPGYRAESMKALLAPNTIDLPSGDETHVAGFRIADRAALQHVKPPEWILDDFIPDESYVMLFGAPWTFKTFLALDMALTIACENPVNTLWTPLCRGPVLFIAGEGRSSMAKRVKAWEQVHNGGKQVQDFVLVDPVPLISITEEYLTALIGDLTRRHPDGYFLTVNDTVGRSMAGADENTQQAASAFTMLTQRLRAGLGGSVLALHHSGHKNEERAIGSSVFGRDSDTLVRVDREGKAHTISLTMTNQKEAAEWPKPRRATLAKTILIEGSEFMETLVVIKPSEAVEAEAENNEMPLKLFYELLDKVLADKLSANPTHTWTQEDLSTVIAMDERISIGYKTVTTRLKSLRENNDTVANRCYDAMRSPGAGRWLWRGE